MPDRGASPPTERLLDRLPGPRWMWISLVGLLVAARPLVVYAVELPTNEEPLDRRQLIGNLSLSLVLAYMAMLALWGVGFLFRMAESREQRAREVMGLPADDSRRVISGGMIALGPPVVLTAVATAFSFVEESLTHSVLAAIVTLPLAVAINFPVMTLFWVILSLLLAFNRMGRANLELDRYPEDPSLGMAPLGLVGFHAFWVFIALVVPFLIAAVGNPREFAVGVLFALAPLVLVLLSFSRLHDQMVSTRVNRVNWARELYADAFRLVRDEVDLEKLERNEKALRTADLLTRRAEDIWEWPISGRMLGVLLGITGGVLTSLMTRMLFSVLDF